ncbi:MAG: dephospho-CoA kinase [Candidatus Glassbacteria bacterium RIFCSPLOWO2_12_FULL_58_11]|uniref:Dephospho-CoA kinase n=1 Tax=Candidatus Glassbacteria bacterium RIFCSPLOWO2_12_FULL_58_11 TaxID=1817867 RepID=A0A1F5YKA9_9BACT|nr:MAG: dephospho-CoA kinase [Candidatus Glassbacteria bacterium RIFCSPLOWO2_12_FULL_58_11]
MISIGLTGNAGSGKSTVAKIWREQRGAVVIDADELGRSAVKPGSEALAELTRLFGKEILHEDGSLNRKRTAEIAFSSEENTRALNAVVHPEIIRNINRQLKEAGREGVKAVVVDAALIFEFGFERYVDVMVVVDAPRELKISRMLDKGKMDRRTIEKIMEVQLPPDELKKRADYIIDNSEDAEGLRKKALELFDSLVR